MGIAGRSESLYRSLIGKQYSPFTHRIVAAQVYRYVQIIGDTNPIHTHRAAAQAAGYRDVVVPPTFGFSIALWAAQPDLALSELGVTVNEALHGEQRFDYLAPLCVGDSLTGFQRIEDVHEKKAGTLLFLMTSIQIENQLGEIALRMAQTSIVPLKPNPIL